MLQSFDTPTCCSAKRSSRRSARAGAWACNETAESDARISLCIRLTGKRYTKREELNMACHPEGARAQRGATEGSRSRRGCSAIVDMERVALDTAGSALQGATNPRQGNIPT